MSLHWDRVKARQLLIELRDLCGKHDVFFWLMYGTLLGAVREGDLIEWDSDIDLGALEEEKERVHRLVVPEWKSRGHRLSQQPHFYTFWADDGTGAELVFCRFKNDKLIKSDPAKLMEYPGEYFQRFNRVSVAGKKGFRIPWQAERVLEIDYGPNWRIPEEGKGPSRI